MVRRKEQSPVQHEVHAIEQLRDSVRRSLYGVREGAWRARATTAVAAAAAEEAFRYGDGLPAWWNETAAEWREHLAGVWLFLGGDAQQHYALSTAMATFLTSPLNHNEGQDGPDDFDRPWTVASYTAAASVLLWAVDFASTAVSQIFECIDLKYEGEFPNDRPSEVDARVRWVRGVVADVVREVKPRAQSFDADLLARIRVREA